jgi:predicted O-methyltransferase YrrM
VSEALWTAVDEYIEQQLLGADPVLEAATAASAAAGLPAIAVSPAQGELLNLLTRIHGARRILEVGTLGGYSTICFARALPPEGALVTLELEAEYAAVAAANIERAGLLDRVELRVGPAIDSLDALIAEGSDAFDLVFIDADKRSTPAYFERALSMCRAGSVVIVDNVVRDGELIDADSSDPSVLGMRRFHELLAAERVGGRRLSATTIQTVGSKGYDGFTLVLVDPA